MSAERGGGSGATDPGAGAGGVYLDHAATSHPKPPGVVAAVVAALESGGNAGRGGHGRAGRAAGTVAATRRALARLFGGLDPSRVALMGGATDALNAAIKGVVKPGDHVVTTSLEHNSVMRPLRGLEARGEIGLTVVAAGGGGVVDPADVRAALRRETRLVVMAHASNVLGTVQPVADVAEIARGRGVVMLVDAAQTAGEIPVEVGRLGVHLLAFPGHKGLLGPQGCGGLYVEEGVELAPWKEGGTGTESELEQQPAAIPERLEAGTLPLPAIAGLGAGVAAVEAAGVERVAEHQARLTARVVDGLARIRGVEVYGETTAARKVGVTAFNVAGADPSEVAMVLESAFGVQVRAGLHCAPGAHRTIGTFPGGAVRASTGFSTTEDEVDRFLEAVAEVAGSGLAGS